MPFSPSSNHQTAEKNGNCQIRSEPLHLNGNKKMNNTPSTSEDILLDPEAMARLEAFFASPDANDLNQFSSRFVAKYRDWLQTDKKIFTRRMQYRLSRLRSILNCQNFTGLRVLDAGAGFGMRSLMLALAGASEVVAVDILPGRIKDLTKLIQIAGLDNVTSICGDYVDAANEHGPYDLVIGTCFLSHINTVSSFFDLCRSQLKTEGKLYLMDDNNYLSPVRHITVRKEWWSSEFTGNLHRNKGHFLRRRRIAANAALPPMLPFKRLVIREWCAWATKGMTLSEVNAYCNWFQDRSQPRPPKPQFAYNDPKSGVAEERLLNPLRMAEELRSLDFDVTLFPPVDSSNKKHIFKKIALMKRALDASFEVVAVRRR